MIFTTTYMLMFMYKNKNTHVRPTEFAIITNRSIFQVKYNRYEQLGTPNTCNEPLSTQISKLRITTFL